MNWLDPKNVIINLWRNRETKCSDGDFKKQTEIENDNLSLLIVKGFFSCSLPWWNIIDLGYCLTLHY